MGQIWLNLNSPTKYFELQLVFIEKETKMQHLLSGI